VKSTKYAEIEYYLIEVADSILILGANVLCRYLVMVRGETAVKNLAKNITT